MILKLNPDPRPCLKECEAYKDLENLGILKFKFEIFLCNLHLYVYFQEDSEDTQTSGGDDKNSSGEGEF